MKRSNILIFFLSLLVILLLLKNCNGSKIINSQEELITTLNQTAETWRDSDSLSHAKIQVLEGINAKSFTKLENQSEEIQNLQNLVGVYKHQLKNRGSATIFSTETVYDTILKVKLDTVNICSFEDSISNKYLTANFNLKDSIFKYSFSYRDSFEIVIGEEKVSWFKKKPFVEVKSNNPYSEIKTLRSYQVTDLKSKRFGIGPTIGFGINQTLQPGIFIGVGLNWNFIRF